MKRLNLIGSWKRLGVQLGLLAGVGMAFVGGAEPPKAEAAFQCLMEGQCTFNKPLFLFIADYSTSMNKVFDMNNNTTRWENAVAAIQTTVESQNGFISGNTILGLMRFGHDPQPGSAGTMIANDTSGIVDGQKIDVEFYDAADPNKKYYECNGEAVIAAITGVDAPINGNQTGIGTWTKGALDRAKAYIQQTWTDHGESMTDRPAAIVVLTDGEWTDATGTMALKPAGQNPALTAADLFNNNQVPTYVVAIGEAMGKAFADELAMAGGTTAAIDAVDPAQLVAALASVVESLKEDVIAPVCTPGLPRIMVLLDASSSMLNIENGTLPGGMGETGWDQARDALAGDASIFDVIVMGNKKVENLVHLGLAVFGHNAPLPGEQKLLVDYGPCRKDNFEWALDPTTSCEAPGCDDPWGGPPIMWTFKDGTQPNDPGFDEKTLSHMPKCDKGMNSNACIGSGTYTHLGLQLVQQNIATYKGACQADDFPYKCSDDTEYINILVTDGEYQSTDAQVQAPLEAMYNDGIITYVIGFGDLLDTPSAIAKLNKLADWGSNGTQDYYDANNQAALEDALKSIIEQVTFDPCCNFNECAFTPEPSTIDPDPVVGDTDGTDTGGTGTTTEGTTDATAASTVDPSETTANVSATDTEGDTETPATDTNAETTAGTNPTDPTTGGGNSDSDSGEQPTTGGNPDPTVGPNTTGGNETGDTADADTATETVGGVDDEGCGCTVEDEKGQTRGLLASLLTFGLAGFIRRRRRSA